MNSKKNRGIGFSGSSLRGYSKIFELREFINDALFFIRIVYGFVGDEYCFCGWTYRVTSRRRCV